MAKKRSAVRGVARPIMVGVAALAILFGGVVPAVADASATVSGVVTLDDGGAPVEGVGVFISNTSGGFSLNGYTDAEGRYEVTDVPEGEYIVRFAPEASAPELITEYWDDAPNSGSATRVVVTGAEPVTGVDAALATGGTISGSVSRDSDASPLQGVEVRVIATDGSGSSGWATTRDDGTFAVTGLTTGDYRVQFVPAGGSGVAGEFWQDAADLVSATLVAVTAGAEASRIDASLADAAVISGVVTRASDSSPVGGLVRIRPVGDIGAATVPIEPDGSYRIETAPGSYTLYFEPTDTRLLGEYWQNAATIQEATAVVVVAGEQRTGLDVQLQSGATVSGLVTGGGEALGGITVVAYSGELFAGSVVTDEDGRYSLSLTTGEYVLSASASLENPVFATQFYDRAVTAATATTVVLDGEVDRADVDFDLELGADIRGTIDLADAGAPDGEGATVIAYRWDGEGWVEVARTPSWGPFAFSPDSSKEGGVLAAGTYTFGVEYPGYCTQYLGGASDIADADRIDLNPGDTATGNDVTLQGECEPAAGSPVITVSPGSVAAGGSITVSGAGFAAGEQVEFELHSDPLAVGVLTADASGRLSGALRIPAAAPVGEHTLVALDAEGAVQASVALRVTAAPAGAASTVSDTLAATGSEIPGGAILAALMLAVVGLVLMRRRRASHMV